MTSNNQLPDFDAWWDYQNPDKTEQKFQQLLKQTEVSQYPEYHCQLLTQIARTQGLQGKFDQAHQTLDQAQGLISNKDSVEQVRYLLERGRVFRSSARLNEARPLFLDAWELGNKLNEDYFAIDAAHMMGIVEPAEKQLEWNLKALAQVEATKDAKAKKWAGSLYNNIGWTYHDMEDHDEALAIFQKGLAYEQQQQDNVGRIHIATWNMARTLRSLQRIEEALEIQRELIKDIESHKVPDSGYVHEELGECLFALGQKEAKIYFAHAYQTMSQDAWLVENEPERLAHLKELSKVSDK